MELWPFDKICVCFFVADHDPWLQHLRTLVVLQQEYLSTAFTPQGVQPLPSMLSIVPCQDNIVFHY